MKNKLILITGALGQDGKIITNIFFKNKKYKVIGIDNKKNLKTKKINIFKIDLLNKNLINKFLFKHKPDYIIHFAAKNYSYNYEEKNNYKIDYLYNYNITKNLINSIIDSKIKTTFFFTGSSRMFEGYKNKIIKEKTKFKTKNYYSKYKVDIYYYLKKIKKKKLKSCTMILFNHDSKFRGSKFLLPRLIKYFMKKKISKIIEIYNSNILGDFSHAEDICRGIYLLIVKKKNPNKIILSSFKLTSISKIIIYLNSYYNLNIKFPQLKKKTNYLIGDNSFARSCINFKPKKSSFIAINDLIKHSKKKIINF